MANNMCVRMWNDDDDNDYCDADDDDNNDKCKPFNPVYHENV